MPDLTGYSFGRYHLIEQLGEGGMGYGIQSLRHAPGTRCGGEDPAYGPVQPAQMEQGVAAL